MVIQFGCRFVTTSDDFVKAFLKKFYPIHKTALIRKNIMHFRQEQSEPFWRYFERFKDLLAQCPHHGVEKWRQCQISTMVQIIRRKSCQKPYAREGSCKRMRTKVRIYLRIQLRKPCNRSQPRKTKEFIVHSFKRRALSLESSIAVETKIATLKRRQRLQKQKSQPMSTKSTHHQFTIRVVHTVRQRTIFLKSALFFRLTKCSRNT